MVEIDLRRRYERPAPDAALDEPAPLQYLIGLADGHAAHAQRRGELALRRQLVAGGESAALDAGRELLLDLLVGRLGGREVDRDRHWSDPIDHTPPRGTDRCRTRHRGCCSGRGRDSVRRMTLDELR